MKERVVRASNTHGGACNFKAAPYFNIVPSCIMFQQNGRRTRGSASATRRVVYLKHTIPSLLFCVSVSHPPPPISAAGARDERDRMRATESEGQERGLEKLRGRLERRPTTTLSNQPLPPATPFSFSFRVVCRRMEDGKPAMVRVLTTFFRFSRRREGMGGWEEKIGSGRQKPGTCSLPCALPRRTGERREERGERREETPTRRDLPRQVTMYRGKFPAENNIHKFGSRVYC